MSHRHVQPLIQIREEFDAARAALAYVHQEWARIHLTPTFQQQMRSLAFQDVESALANLEDTYMLRAFAIFEDQLRSQLASLKPKPKIPKNMEALVDRVALRFHIPDTERDEVHEVRIYRNWLIHRGALPGRMFDFPVALSVLSRYLAILLP